VLCYKRRMGAVYASCKYSCCSSLQDKCVPHAAERVALIGLKICVALMFVGVAGTDAERLLYGAEVVACVCTHACKWVRMRTGTHALKREGRNTQRVGAGRFVTLAARYPQIRISESARWATTCSRLRRESCGTPLKLWRLCTHAHVCQVNIIFFSCSEPHARFELWLAQLD